MHFEIIIDESFTHLSTDKSLQPVSNKMALSMLNDFEDGKWRYSKFRNFIWDNICETALSQMEREKLANQSHSLLTLAAKHLRLTDKVTDIGHGSELAEIVLYGIMKHHYKALPVVPKIFYKQNSNDNAKGADSVHIVLEGGDNFSIWFGEAKFYNGINDARLSSIIDSVGNSLKTEKLKKENSIITNIGDIDHLIDNEELLNKIKLSLSNKNSIDSLKPKINIPILILHECKITSNADEINDSYINKVKTYHIDRINSYFTKQITALSGSVHKYKDIKFHIILFPIPNKQKIIEQFVDNVNYYKGQ